MPLPREQELRELRAQARKDGRYDPSLDEGDALEDIGDPSSSNLFVGNLHPDVDEEVRACWKNNMIILFHQ